MPTEKRISIVNIKNRKGLEPIICLTAYTAPIAKILDDYVDILLVGDSVGMVLYGMKTTLEVTMEMMLEHGKAVVNSSIKSCVVVDMPFGSYQESKEQAFRNAARIMSYTGCNAIKLEGGQQMADTISFLSERGIPVMAHIGLLPQSVNSLGGYRRAGKTDSEKQNIMNDAKAVDDSGAFCVVLENMDTELAEQITEKIKIPTIGIGASPKCDGQVLVTEDILGLSGNIPYFVKPYGNLQEEIRKSVEKYCNSLKK